VVKVSLIPRCNPFIKVGLENPFGIGRLGKSSLTSGLGLLEENGWGFSEIWFEEVYTPNFKRGDLEYKAYFQGNEVRNQEFRGEQRSWWENTSGGNKKYILRVVWFSSLCAPEREGERGKRETKAKDE